MACDTQPATVMSLSEMEKKGEGGGREKGCLTQQG